MARFAPYSRRELRRSFIVWLKRNPKVVTGICAGAVVLICLESVLLVQLVPSTPFKWYLLGAVHVWSPPSCIFFTSPSWHTTAVRYCTHAALGAKTTLARNSNERAAGD